MLLPKTAPEVSTKFQQGDHVVKRSEIPFLTLYGLILDCCNQLLKFEIKKGRYNRLQQSGTLQLTMGQQL